MSAPLPRADLSRAERLARVRAIIAKEQAATPPPRAIDMADAIRAKHGDTVQAFVFYGSGLREADNIEKMLDYYVLTRSYKSIHGFGPKALASFALPPSVHYLEATDRDARPMNSKYSIVSLPAFQRRVSGRAREPMIWARFSQPCLIMSCATDALQENLISNLAQAVTHFADQASPLMAGKMTPHDFWARALSESYRTELRAERPLERAREIVERYGERYTALGEALFGARDADGNIDIPPASMLARQGARWRWATRRWVGKPATALRVLKAAFTFDGGLDYVLHKLKSHSDVAIDITPHQRRHPILWSPVLAWKLWRRGAFR
ncbi:MAG: hypothetical protein ABJG15_17565 [Hyphomonadaceae bacterium]